jgi:phage terminase Nu1 subunit (DNA packaging protein)
LSTTKDNLSEVTLSQLETLTGICFRTLKKRLGALAPTRVDGKSIFFDPQVALPVIYEVATAESLTKRMNPEQEKARLSRAQAELRELDLAERRRQLISSETIEHIWSDMVTSARSRLLGLPSKCAPLAFGAESVAVAEDVLKTAIFEALSELSEEIPAIEPDGSGDENGEALGSAAETDGESVGGLEEDALS